MAIRDHVGLDVLVRRAAALHELDAQLGEVERLLALDESATAGACAACGASTAQTPSATGGPLCVVGDVTGLRT